MLVNKIATEILKTSTNTKDDVQLLERHFNNTKEKLSSEEVHFVNARINALNTKLQHISEWAIALDEIRKD